MLHLFVLILVIFQLVVSGAATKEELEFSSEVYKLLVKARGGKEVKYSPNLAKVAQLHAEDLNSHHNIKQKYCNMHSWYTTGDTNCCYTEDHGQAKCMWEKPKQFSNYQSNGYEVAYFGKGYGIGPKSVIDGFLNSKGHRVVILNEGDWKKEWNACGVGHKGGYTTIWFGHDEDKEANKNFKYPTYDEIPAYPTQASSESNSNAPTPTSTSTSTPNPSSSTSNTPTSSTTSVTIVTPSPSASTISVTDVTPTATSSASTSTSDTTSSTTTSSATTETSACPQPSVAAFKREDFKGDIWYKQGNEWKYLPPLTWVVDESKNRGYFKAAESFKSTYSYIV
ncbi:hypothetical protein K502DRAFT_343168 [Neoconidiobolus thromboides FSU 785]|nr:hypothetical protein K502DRAFT_343168 [Neoconidiobolus thromboides FSU 785]